MDTQIFTANEINKAATLIRAGELVAFPTETVYGLGADATNEASVQKVYEAKGRPSDNPLIVHVADLETVNSFVDNIPEKADKLAEKFWPGPLTIILPVKKGTLSKAVTGGLSTVAFRLPNNRRTIELIRQAGVPLVGPSANTSGKPSPTSAQHVFHDLQGKIAGILDDGETQVGIESTVLDLSGEVPMILRPGAILQQEIEAVIGPIEVYQHLVSANETPKAPGMKYKHYAPNAKVVMMSENFKEWQQAIDYYRKQGEKVALLANREILKHFASAATATFCLTENNNVQEAMKNLYKGLRELDELDVTVILAEGFENAGLGIAYMNRLKKAANGEKFSL